MKPDDSKFSSIPVGKLGIIAMESCKDLGAKVDEYLVKWHKEREHEYQKDSYLRAKKAKRFASRSKSAHQ